MQLQDKHINNLKSSWHETIKFLMLRPRSFVVFFYVTEQAYLSILAKIWAVVLKTRANAPSTRFPQTSKAKKVA